jgi:hypothetical protein
VRLPSQAIHDDPICSYHVFVYSKRNALGITTYRYLYSGNFSNVTPRYWLGGMHSCSCPFPTWSKTQD